MNLKKIIEWFKGVKVKDFDKFSKIEDMRIYTYPENYSVVWRGDISLDKLFEKEKKLYERYQEFEDLPSALIIPKKEIRYLTFKERFEFTLDGKGKQYYEHSDFLTQNKDTITFARVDNSLFSLWADIYENNNKDDRSEVGISLKDMFIKEFVDLYEDTNFKKVKFSDRKRRKIVSIINKRVKSYQKALLEKENLESKLPVLCAYTINDETEEICGAIMQQLGDEWVCTRDDRHRYSIYEPKNKEVKDDEKQEK